MHHIIKSLIILLLAVLLVWLTQLLTGGEVSSIKILGVGELPESLIYIGAVAVYFDLMILIAEAVPFTRS